MSFKTGLHKTVYHVSLFFACFGVRRKYHFQYTGKRVHLKEPTMVISNHTTESDMICVASNFHEHMYVVCGEHLMRTPVGPWLSKFFDPITPPKGGSHMSYVKQMTKRLRAGYNILLFPEGSRSFNGITEELGTALAKLIKISKCGLVTYHMTGGYFVAPRWAYHFRKGPITGEIKHTFTSEEIRAMSPEELTRIINEDLYENAYETQRMKPQKYVCREGLAEGLENYLILCPNCGRYDSLSSKGDEFSCACGLKGKYTEEGFLQSTTGEPLPFDSVADWGKWMETAFDKNMEGKDPSELLFTETGIRYFSIDAIQHTSADLVTGGTLKVYSDRMEMDGKVIPFADISEAAMLYFGKTLLFSTSEGYFGLTGEAFHAWKEARLYRNYMLKTNPGKAMNAF